ncbi:Patched family-containing protein [Aphelenchoides bicaudatus]|nr:Patched family-containing protein [Aphelenchoides bicaudatus]
MPSAAESDSPPSTKADSPPRIRPTSTRGMDDALPQTPKYKSMDKMLYSSGETAPADQQNSSEREQTERVYVDDDREDLRVCTLVPRHRTIPHFVVPNEFMNGANRKFYHLPTSRFIEGVVKPALFHLAKTASHRKFIFVTLPIFLTGIVLIAPFYFWDQMKISTPFSSFISGPDPTNPSIKDIRLNSQNLYFNSTKPEFDAIRRTSQAEFGILMSTRNHFTNIISNSTLSTYQQLKHEIQNISVLHSFLSLNWDDICREDCKAETPIVESLQKKKVILKYPEAVMADDPDGKRIFFANFFGDFEWNGDGIVTRARSILMNLKLKENLSSETYRLFESRLKELIQSKQGNNEMRFHLWSVRNFMKDVSQMLTIVHWRLIACAGILVFCCLLFSIRAGDSYRTRPFVGIQTGIILVLCPVIGYCVQISAGGGQFNAMAFPVLYVVVACGVLLFFSMMQTWNRYSLAALHPIEKLAFIYSWDGPVMILSLLVVIASSICVALFSQLQYMQVCFFTLATGLTAILAFGLFYMTVCWFCSGRREAEGLKWFQLMKQGDRVFNEKCVIDYDRTTASILHEKMADLKPSFSRHCGKFATNSGLRTVTIVAFTCYTIFAIIGCCQRLQIRMHEEDFVETNSSSAQYLHRYRHAFKKYENYLELVFDSNVDYYDKEQRALMLDLLTGPVRDQHATKTVSWLLEFDRFQDQSIYDINSDTLVPIVNYVFLNDHQKFSTDIIFDKFKTQIIKSRSYLELSSKGVEEIQDVVRNLLAKAERARIPLSIKTPLVFSLHHDLQIMQKSLINGLILLLSASIFTLVLFGQPSMALSVLFSCVSVSLGVLGYSSYLLIPLNVVTLNVVLLGNIFTLITSLHFCYMFVNAGLKQQNSVARVQYAFQCSLWPTILACVVLAGLIFPLPLAIDAPVLVHIWKTFLAISVLTFLNTFFVLPGVMIIFTEYVSIMCGTFNRVCTENGCFGAEQPNGQHRRMILGAPTTTAPPEYAFKSSSIMFTSDGLPYSPRRECRIREADSQQNSRPGSTRNASSQHQTPRRERRLNQQKSGDNDSLANEEQIYEDPDESMTLPHNNAANVRNIRIRGLPRDEPAYRVDHPSPQNWRQYIFESRGYPSMPYVSSPSGTRKYM